MLSGLQEKWSYNMKACKHGHVDGVRHIPCPKCQAEYWQSQIEERDRTIQALLAEVDRLNNKVKAKKKVKRIKK